MTGIRIIRVDQIFRLSCLRRHVLGWVKKRVRRNIIFLSAPSCSTGLPKFLRVLNRTPNFFWSEIGRVWYQKSKIEKTRFLVKNLAEYKSRHLFKFYSFQVHFKRKCQE